MQRCTGGQGDTGSAGELLGRQQSVSVCAPDEQLQRALTNMQLLDTVAGSCTAVQNNQRVVAPCRHKQDGAAGGQPLHPLGGGLCGAGRRRQLPAVVAACRHRAGLPSFSGWADMQPDIIKVAGAFQAARHPTSSCASPKAHNSLPLLSARVCRPPAATCTMHRPSSPATRCGWQVLSVWEWPVWPQVPLQAGAGAGSQADRRRRAAYQHGSRDTSPQTCTMRLPSGPPAPGEEAAICRKECCVVSAAADLPPRDARQCLH